jgi:thiamine biosynthesis lipoprotein
MGTVLEVTVVAEEEHAAREMAARAITIARHWEDVLTTWRPDGELAGLNARAGAGHVEISGDLRAALATMQQLVSDTAGAFDPAVGPLVVRYATPSTADDKTQKPLPISEVLLLESGRASLASGAALDAGGVGKGLALDAIAVELRRGGAKGAFLDFGGSSQLAFGRSEAGEPWRVAVAGIEPGQILGTIDLDGALATSRSRPAGDASGPIVDPRDGSLVVEPRLATCVAPSAAVADAWSTALVVLGSAALARAETYGVTAVVQRAGGPPLSSPGFAQALVSLGRTRETLRP